MLSEYSTADGLYASLGGLLLGISISLHFVFYGRLTGASGVLDRIFSDNSQGWHFAFFAGIYMAAFTYIKASGGLTLFKVPTYFLVISGLTTGFGTRVANGCTSGHGLCGLSRISPRSIAAVASFLGTGIVTANAVHFRTYEVTLNHSTEWFSFNDYLGWPLFVLSGVVVLMKILNVKNCEKAGCFVNNMRETLLCWFFGALFGTGLSFGGMIQNRIVLNFLKFDKYWNPNLLFVLCVGVIVFTVVYHYRHINEIKPVYSEKAEILTNQAIDMRLIGGSVLFGFGWGLSGICPAPMVSTLGVPIIGTVFLPSAYVGMQLSKLVTAADKQGCSGDTVCATPEYEQSLTESQQ